MTPGGSSSGPRISLVTATLKAGQGIRLGPATVLFAGKGRVVVRIAKTRLELKPVNGRQAACVCRAEDGPHPLKISADEAAPLVVLGQGRCRRAIYPRDLEHTEESENDITSGESATG